MRSRLSYATRCALLPVTGQALAELMVPGDPAPWLRVMRPTVPPDARYIAMHLDPTRDTVYLMFEHPSFAEVTPGMPLPLIDPPAWEVTGSDPAAGPHVVPAG